MSDRTMSRSWWERTKKDERLLSAWLKKQHRGEATAAQRIEMLRDRYAHEPRAARTLSVIAEQERKHAAWVKALLDRRGISSDTAHAEERYWVEPLAQIHDLETGCAVGAHAERMRLARIEAICDDVTAPADVREVFTRILPEERFHERAFRELAGEAAMTATRDAHEVGRRALGLVP